MRKYALKAYFKKKTICFVAVIMLLLSCFPVQALAVSQKEPPALPYEKDIYQNGSWMTLWDSGQLFSIYDGNYEIDEALFINKKTGANISDIPSIKFRINKDQVVSAIYLPYIYYPLSAVQQGNIEPVYVQLEDDRGNMYGPYLMEGMEQKLTGSRNDSTAEAWEEMVDDEPRTMEAKAIRYMYTFRSQGELRLPKGSYTLHTSDSANLVRTKSSGLEGPVFIKGYEGSAYDKYKEKLLLWNMKNNPQLYENKTLIRELVDGEEAESNKIVEEEYTVLGNMELFEYNAEKDEAKKDYQVQGREENPPANFPLYISLPGPALIDEIVFNTYNGGLGALPGTVSITGVNDEGDYGTFQANGKTLQGVPNGMWVVSPGITLPAGEYMVDVSDKSVVSSFSDGRSDFYIGALPPPPVEHDFSGTYFINVSTQKTGSIGPGFETGESEDSFNLSSHPITILDRGDYLLMIGSYDGITLSRKSPAGSRTLDGVSTFLEFSLDLSGTPAKTTISAAVEIVLRKPEEGVSRMTIGGNASYARDTTEEKDGDYNTYQVSGSGVFVGQDISPAVLPFMGLGMASAGNIPGPDSPSQAAVGILFPPLATVLVGLLESLFRRKDEVLSHADLPPESYDFGDGRQYQEGASYTFDDGGEYIVKNGEFELVGQLGEGDHYTNPDGESKIWSGGQSWHESDLSRQEATNKDYAQAHAEDWKNVSSSPDKYMEEAFDNINEQERLYDDLGRMERAAWRSGMASPGELDDMYSRINELMKDMDAGKPADTEKIQRIRDYMDGRFSGHISHERDLPMPEQYGGLLDMGLLSDTLTQTVRSVTNLTTADGSMSWKGLAVRAGMALVTGMQSEWAFRGIGATYTMHDAIQAGASNLGAFGAGVGRVGTEWAVTNVMAGIVSTIGGAGSSGISHLMSTGGSGSGLGSAILSGGSEGASRWGAGMIAQVTDLGSRQAWAAQASLITDSLTRGVTRMDNILSGQEGLQLPGWGSRVQVPINAPKQALNPLEQKQLSDFERAVRSGDPDQIARQYANGGMKKLSQIQQKGHITADTAREANQLLARKANSAIQQGTNEALKKTQQQTGVRVKELIVGDSGSGAKKAVNRIMTDVDRTLIPRFEEAGLQKYMRVNKMSRAQAYDSLCKQLQKNHISSVGKSLGKSGLSVDDVGFASYDRIGSVSGQADSYGSRFTNMRQASSGTAQVYTPDGKGGFKIHSTSGQAAVDQNLLNKQIYGTGTIPSDPVKLLPRDVPSIIKQQAGSMMRSPSDPLAAAKAIGRANWASRVIKNNGILSKSMQDMNGKLVRMANEINSNHGSMNTVLRNNGMTLNQFLKQSKDLLSGYNHRLSGLGI